MNSYVKEKVAPVWIAVRSCLKEHASITIALVSVFIAYQAFEMRREETERQRLLQFHELMKEVQVEYCELGSDEASFEYKILLDQLTAFVPLVEKHLTSANLAALSSVGWMSWDLSVRKCYAEKAIQHSAGLNHLDKYIAHYALGRILFEESLLQVSRKSKDECRLRASEELEKAKKFAGQLGEHSHRDFLVINVLSLEWQYYAAIGEQETARSIAISRDEIRRKYRSRESVVALASHGEGSVEFGKMPRPKCPVEIGMFPGSSFQSRESDEVQEELEGAKPLPRENSIVVPRSSSEASTEKGLRKPGTHEESSFYQIEIINVSSFSYKPIINGLEYPKLLPGQLKMYELSARDEFTFRHSGSKKWHSYSSKMIWRRQANEGKIPRFKMTLCCLKLIQN